MRREFTTSASGRVGQQRRGFVLAVVTIAVVLLSLAADN